MRILLDCSQIRRGGAIQAALSLLGNAARDHDREWHLVASSELARQMGDGLAGRLSSFRALPIPNGAIRRWRTPGQHLPRIENALRPDVVFTLFGPAWWRARAPHVVGFARGLMLCPGYVGPGREPVAARVRRAVEFWLRERDFRRADHLVAETGVVREAVARCLGFPMADIFV
ncbi:MAG: hypothetical protein ACYSU0_04455, partial [Planctomycetota bacterium]